MIKKAFYLYKRQRNTYYSCQFRNPITGELGAEVSTGETNKTKAEVWARERLIEKKGSATLFGEYAAPFFGPDCPRCNRYKDEGKAYSPGTLNNYRRYLLKMILADKIICAIPLGNIRRGDIVQLRERWRKAKGNITLEKPLETIRTILSEALYMEYIEYNPAEKVRNVAYTKRTANYLTIPQIKQLIKPENFTLNHKPNKYAAKHGDDEDNGFRFCVATALYAFAGMRASEIRALKWKDIDLAARRIHVKRAFKEKKNTLGPPKNGYDRFTVIADILLPYLSTPKDQETWVCGTISNHPMGYKKWHELYQSICEKLKFPHTTLHGLRHVLNTALLEKYEYHKELIKAALGWSIEDGKGRGEKRFGTDIQEKYTHRKQYDLSPLIVDINELFADKKEGAEIG